MGKVVKRGEGGVKKGGRGWIARWMAYRGGIG